MLASAGEIESKVRSARVGLSERLGYRFADLGTNLAEVKTALDYAAELIVAVPTITPTIAQTATAGGAAAPNPAELEAALQGHDVAAKDLSRLLTEEGWAARTAAHLNVSFTERMTDLARMQERIDEIHDWVELRDLTAEFGPWRFAGRAYRTTVGRR
jgi:hypothetical protein